jgi:hypothetical protein
MVSPTSLVPGRGGQKSGLSRLLSECLLQHGHLTQRPRASRVFQETWEEASDVLESSRTSPLPYPIGQESY